MLLKTKGKFGNIRHTPFKDIENSGSKVDRIQNKQIVNLKKKVRKIERDREVKWFDYGASAVAVTEAGVNLAAGGIAFGIIQAAVANENSRIGDSITTTSLLLKMQIYNDSADLEFGSPCRVVVFWDSQANGAVPSISGTANSLMEASGVVLGHLDHRKQNTIDRFDILMDKVYNINPKTVSTFNVATGATTGLTSNAIYINKRFKLGRKIKYSGNAGAITDLAGNNICVAVISAAASQTLVSYNMRLHFKDD